MKVFEIIKNRRSIRKYTVDDVSEEEIIKLIDAARWAPSAGNIQPWEFIIVRNGEMKYKLSVLALNQAFIREAPVVIVVCANQSPSKYRYGLRGINLYCIQDTAAATQNILLSAYALGLGACWVGAFNEEEVRKALNLPQTLRPVVIVPVGYSAEKACYRSRKSIGEIIHFEKYRLKNYKQSN